MTKIWTFDIDLEGIKQRNENSMITYLGIEFTEIGDDFMVAKMPVDERTKQPYGILHGGSSCVLAETVGSVAANCCIDHRTSYAVGMEINTSHIRSIKSGWIIGTARPQHLGRTTQVWEIPIVDEQGRMVSMTRLRMAVLERETTQVSPS